MFFRNLQIYRLTQTLEIAVDDLEAALASKPARPCASQEMSTYGFMAPIGKGEDAPLVHVVGGYLHIASKHVTKVLPGSVVKDALKAKVEEIEFREQRKVYKKERDQIKDDIIQAALPHAFSKYKVTHALIIPGSNLIIVDASTSGQAEDLLSTVRECIGSLPVRPLTVKIAPTAMMTDWVKNQEAPENFYILDECVLRDSQEGGGSITARGQDLTSDEIQLHLATGKLSTELSMAYQDKLSFKLNDQLKISRLKFEDMLHDQAEQDGGDDAMGQMQASIIIMGGTLIEFIGHLTEALGGEEIPEGISGVVSSFTPKPMAQVENSAEPAQYHGDPDADPLYPQAVANVRETQKASISATQRKLKIGYNRAARMIEQMEIDGVITSMNSNGHREIIQ